MYVSIREMRNTSIRYTYITLHYYNVPTYGVTSATRHDLHASDDHNWENII